MDAAIALGLLAVLLALAALMSTGVNLAALGVLLFSYESYVKDDEED